MPCRHKPLRKPIVWLGCCAVALLSWVAVAQLAAAGGGPENLFLVVNSNSDTSKTVANHYIRMRKIPACNVMYLDWKGGLNNTSGKDFRERILKPILGQIEARRIAPQIDYIVYSTDFPWRVDFNKNFEGEKLSPQFRPLASLTGATYLWAYTMSNNPALVMPTTNWYVPKSPQDNGARCRDCGDVPTQGFRSRYAWLEGGRRAKVAKDGQRYFLSTMLGVTVTRGNSEAEILNYLSRSVAADATQPDGTFYYMKNSDVRSKARHGCYKGVGALLTAESASVVIRDGTVPDQAASALGIMAGVKNFSLGSKVNIAPGAICEHFTSHGAEFSALFQTKISAWLRAGAAGSSGTVFEPFAIQAKFPLPTLHLHYRRGASLGEAYYQSVMGPYQLLVVGDPLCQPWARPPVVKLPSVAAGERVQGVVKLKAAIVPHPGTKVGLCELYVDGRQVARYPPSFAPPLNTAQLAPGAHEIRLVASTSDPLQYQGRAIVPINVAGADGPKATADSRDDKGDSTSPAPTGAKLVTIAIDPEPMVAAGSKIRVEVRGPADAVGIEILQNLRRVGFVEGTTGRVQIDTQLLGRGPVALKAAVAGYRDPPVETDADEETKPKPPERWQRPMSAPAWIMIR